MVQAGSRFVPSRTLQGDLTRIWLGERGYAYMRKFLADEGTKLLLYRYLASGRVWRWGVRHVIVNRDGSPEMSAFVADVPKLNRYLVDALRFEPVLSLR